MPVVKKRVGFGSVGALALALGLVIACSKQSENDETGSASNNGGGTSHNTNGTSLVANGGGTSLFTNGGTAGTSDTQIGNTSPSSCTPQPDDTGCVGAAFEGESIPLDILVMFDLSCSMSCTVDQSGCCLPQNASVPQTWRLYPVRSAMRTFLQDPESAGIGVGLAFFGNHPLNANRDPVVCSVEHYSTASVGIAPLPGNATELIDALDAGMPEGGTPTHLAIDGACKQVSNFKTSNPGHKVVVLLVTDGIPEYSCNATIQLAEAAAGNCFANGTGTEIYVLGVTANNNGQGNSLTQLDRIAVAGGTEHAYLTDTKDVAGSMLAALNSIRADAVIPCDLTIPPPPPGETLAPDKLNIGICNPSGQPVPTPYVGDVNSCGDHAGWYYNDPNSPSTIHLCNVTCDTVKAAGSSLFFSVGCKTQDITILQ
jgi:hypothetical protein